MIKDRRSIPAVHDLLQTDEAALWVEQYGHPLTVDALRATLEQVRSGLREGGELPTLDAIKKDVQRTLAGWVAPTLTPVINATGVILHTNLGRAPLSQTAMRALAEVGLNYSTLEFDLASGKRGSRSLHAEALLTRLTGAEAALVVNNNAAAVLLALTALAKGKRAIISRSQLVEIGGGFRVPDVMRQSGARLVEIGATNKVHLRDYEQALLEPCALVMRAHHSNFKIVGFTSEPTLQEVADVAHRAGALLLDDLGSGCLLDTARYGLAHEPTVYESMAAGADVICFSADKLLGGPQAGILIGRREIIHKIARHPLTRAVRADKFCLAALSATLVHYLADEAEREIPIWRMIAASPQQMADRAENWRAMVGLGDVIEGFSTIGGGSLPEETLPTFLLALPGDKANQKLAQLRKMQPPVIARIQDHRVVFDPRTVAPGSDDMAVVRSIKIVWKQG